MPYEWRETDKGECLRLWPHRSLSRAGFVWFIAITSLLALAPLTALIGSVYLWGILPFFALSIWGIWHGLQRSYRDGNIVETLELTSKSISVRHHTEHHQAEWQADPYWVKPTLHKNHQIPSYLTLRGGAREVELGAFLTATERENLYADLQNRLKAQKQKPAP